MPYLTAYRALFTKGHAKVCEKGERERDLHQAGESLLIHGASGGVGLALTQLASSHGLRVTGTASTDTGLELVASFVFQKGKSLRDPVLFKMEMF